VAFKNTIVSGSAKNKSEFPELVRKVKLAVPDEASRRVGQAIAAASLPVVKAGKK